jgi:hypothetical protein
MDANRTGLLEPTEQAVVDRNTEIRQELYTEWLASMGRPCTLRTVGFRRGLEYAIKAIDPEFYANEIADDNEEQP